MASGVLQDFWSGAAQFSKDGYIRDEDDQTLEDWANWKGKPGAFANWVRTQHMDADGRINDWDEYMGVLESKRAKDRERKRLERERKKTSLSNGTSHGTSDGSHADSRRDVRTYDTERDVTERNETKRTKDQKRTGTPSRPVAPWVTELAAVWTTHVGHVTPAKIQRALAALVAEYTAPVVKAALEIYVSPDEGPPPDKPKKPEWFAENFHRWRSIAEAPLAEDGVLTERGRRLMARPA